MTKCTNFCVSCAILSSKLIFFKDLKKKHGQVHSMKLQCL